MTIALHESLHHRLSDDDATKGVLTHSDPSLATHYPTLCTQSMPMTALRGQFKNPGGGCLLSREAVNLGCLNNGTQGMEAAIIDDELWTLIEPLLPPPKPRRKEHPGRPRVSDRAALNGILFVLKTGLRWNHLPTVLGFGSGATCWRRLNDWRKAGVWDRLHELLLDKLREAGQIDLSYAAVDSSSVRAVGAGEKLARTPRIARDPVPSTTSS
jgi:transposase